MTSASDALAERRRPGTRGPCVRCGASGPECGPYTLLGERLVCWTDCLEAERRDQADAETVPPDPVVTAGVVAELAKERASEAIVDVRDWLEADASDARPVWGMPRAPLWTSGEPLLLTASEGVGKTTLVQRLGLARIGVGDGLVLGLMVEVTDRPVLYVAGDRPRQARSSLSRMVTRGSDEWERLGRLRVWRGPLPFALNDPDAGERLVDLAVRAGDAGTLLLDTLGALAVDLVTDEGGLTVSRALAMVCAADVDVVVSHHDRKTQAAERRTAPRLSDVYGSRWLTAHAGSVVYLTGRAGDPIIGLHHLKAPADEVGPLMLTIDHATGTIAVNDELDPKALLRTATTLTAKQLADIVWPGGQRADRERARRALERLVVAGSAERHGGGAAGEAVEYGWAEAVHDRGSREAFGREDSRGGHAAHEFVDFLGSRGGHAGNAEGGHAPAPLYREGGAYPAVEVDALVAMAAAGNVEAQAEVDRRLAEEQPT